MAGYIGSKAVTLSTTAADVAGNAVIDGDLTVKGTTVTIDSAAVQEIRLGDNDKMTFGDATGGDLQIYHDGSNSYIDDAGTGNLTIRANQINFDKYTGEAMARFRADGNTELFYDNAAKLATTSTGIDVTGTVTADGLTVDGDVVANGTGDVNGAVLIVDDAGSLGIEIQSGSPTLLFKEDDTTNENYQIRLSSGDLLFQTQNDARNSAATKMTLDASGNVGIGTSSPSTPLHIKDSNGGLVQTIETGDSNSAYTKYINSTTGSGAYTDGLLVGIDTDESATFWQYEASHMKFGTSGTERMRIDSSGNFLLGKTSVSWTLDGTQIENGGETLGVTSSLGGNNFFARKNNATGTMFAFWYNSTSVGSITNTTSSVSYNTSSDYRLKENVTDVTDGITRVKQLSPKRFNFIADPDATVDGFIAHEVQDVIPEAISGTKDAMRDEEYEVTPAVEATFDEDGNVLTEAVEAVMGTRSVPDYQGIDQSKLVPLLTAALQEAIAKIETLETEMTSVKARLDALEA